MNSTPDQRDLLKGAEKQLSLYINNNICTDFEAISPTIRLTILNAAAKKAIRRREIGGKQIAYLDHFFAKKAANFLFNFDVGVEIISTDYSTTKGNKGEIYECSRDVRFTFPSKAGHTSRMVTGTAKSYENPAISRYDVKKMALSNAWTLFLQSFGISPKELENTDVYHAAEPAPVEAPTINKLTY